MNTDPIKTEWEVTVSGEPPRIYQHKETADAVSEMMDKRRTVKLARLDTYRTELPLEPQPEGGAA